ncbi:hypothetical protein AB5J62_41065 [Amycolatopsis sp. cg5]|uniref:hypothetical protein n=1 Tax=Amycolatopsis sp. cg5 TaxID=3238802 RepID=UPI0035248318
MRRRPDADFDHAELPKAHRIRWWVAAVLAGLIAAGFAVVPYLDVFQNSAFVRNTKVPTVISWAVLQTAIVVSSAVLTLFYIGKARLEGAAYRANQIDIKVFVDERPDGSHDREVDSAVELTAAFKRILNESRLYDPTPVPGVGGSYDFIQIVETAGESADGWWKVATKLIKLAQPPAAFQISGTVRPGNVNGRYQLILELVRMPRFAASPLVIEDDNWPRVLHQAANAVAALVIPRSAYVRKNIHWAAWRDAKIPWQLFDAYQRSNYFVEHNRYDEALAEYYRALTLDPSNVYIRLEIASLQEQLDLHLDALATYDDVITICSRGRPSLARWWIGRDFERQPRVMAKHQEVALLLARYRHALVLGHGDSIASSWWVRKPRRGADSMYDARISQRAELRAALRLRFERYVELDIRTCPQWISRSDRQARHNRLLRAPVDELVVPTATKAEKKRYDDRAAELRSYLCALSQYEIERLIEDYHSFWRRYRHTWSLLTNRALRLCLAWVVLRRAMADVDPHTGAVPRPQPAYPEPKPKLLPPNVFPAGTWPPEPKALTKVVQGSGHRSSWAECYNAASVYAVALMKVGPRGQSDMRRKALNPHLAGTARDQVARSAVRELYHAATVSHSGRLAGRRSWVMDEDPDLVALRGHELFRVFEMVTFAPDRPAPLRPHRAHVWQQASYLRQLIFDIAGCRARFWHAKARDTGPAPDDRTVDEWRAIDGDVWRQLRDLAVSRQDWYTRFQAICAYRRWSVESGYPGKVAGFPAYTEDLLALQHRGFHGVPLEKPINSNKIAPEYIMGCDRRLDQLVAAVKSLDNTPLPEDFCRRADYWRALAAWFDDRVADGTSAETRRLSFLEISA